MSCGAIDITPLLSNLQCTALCLAWVVHSNNPQPDPRMTLRSRTAQTNQSRYFCWNSAIFAPVGSVSAENHPTFGISTESI
jgi:hypothetical protein